MHKINGKHHTADSGRNQAKIIMKENSKQTSITHNLLLEQNPEKNSPSLITQESQNRLIPLIQSKKEDYKQVWD